MGASRKTKSQMAMGDSHTRRIYLQNKPFLGKEAGDEKIPVDFPVVGFGVGWLECGLCRG